MSNTPKELSPYMSPDSLRRKTQLLKNLIDLHTKKYCGYEDINGSQYEGTVENFGAELLLETRKILLDKPSLKNVSIENTFDFYFDIQYTELIDTYDQQNMLCAVLRKDSLLNRKMRIQFGEITKIRIPRSDSWSDPIVYSDDTYVKTTIPPTITILDQDNNFVENHTLKLTDITGGQTTYFFHIGKETQDFIESIDYDTGILTLKPITNEMCDLPFIWMCINLFKYLPDIGFHNEYIGWDSSFDHSTYDNNPFLTIGTDGHGQALIYPWMTKASCPTNFWFRGIVKVYAEEGFLPNQNSEYNYTTTIKEIRVLVYDFSVDDEIPSTEPVQQLIIKYDNTYAKISLNNFTLDMDVEGVPRTYRWKFKKPEIGDYDYDGTTYNNPYYAYTGLISFHLNTEDWIIQNKRTKLTPGFVVHFDNKYLNEYEGFTQDAVSGIHVDITSDHSDNAVSKKNGVIHNLGDFDGLPTYFKYMIDDDVHRAHVEAYTIKDKLNDVKQNAMDRRTAGVIIDSAIPQNKILELDDSLNINIKYDIDDQTDFAYRTYGDIMSPLNIVSEITYSNNSHFGNSTMSKHANEHKFIYHGGNYFSLNMIGFDPFLETGRVYIISNDGIEYGNNKSIDNPKPDRTFARICDIPTHYSQLIHIKNYAPTFVFDEDYIRTELNFDSTDLNILLSRKYMQHLARLEDKIVFNVDDDLDAFLPYEYVTKRLFPDYVEYDIYIPYSSLNILKGTYDVSDRDYLLYWKSGNGYAVDDTFMFFIGALCIRGKVTSVNIFTGGVTSWEYDNDDYSDKLINVYNLNSLEGYSISTVNVNSNGEGFCVAVGSYSQEKIIHHIDDVYALKLDVYGNVWSWTLNDETQTWNQSYQISGPTIIEDNATYDRYSNRDIFNTKDVFLINTLNPPLRTNTPYWSYGLPTNIIEEVEYNVTDLNIDINSSEDVSQLLSQNAYNKQNAYYVFTINENYQTIMHEIIPSKNHSYTESYILPAYHHLSLTSYYDYTNRFLIDRLYDRTVKNQQPTVYIYDPTFNKSYTMSVICDDMLKKLYEDTFTFKDLLNRKLDKDEMNQIVNNDILKQNVYYYDEFGLDYINRIRETFENMTRSHLIRYIRNNFGNAGFIRYEDDDKFYSYSKDMLVNYIMTNSLYRNDIDNITKTIYQKPNISIFEKIGDNVNDNLPVGGYNVISSEIFDPYVHINSSTIQCELTFIFKLDIEGYDVSSLKGFRITDEHNNDITSSSLLIFNGHLYIANIKNDNVKWIIIK